MYLLNIFLLCTNRIIHANQFINEKTYRQFVRFNFECFFPQELRWKTIPVLSAVRLLYRYNSSTLSDQIRIWKGSCPTFSFYGSVAKVQKYSVNSKVKAGGSLPEGLINTNEKEVYARECPYSKFRLPTKTKKKRLEIISRITSSEYPGINHGPLSQK
ncbi:hypothetical protein BDF21DRAFT_394743 [Thamnidium elegans]|nr:hypothetical protein BDF21DRAFT_394743 [Thamnidium elegans]